MRKLTLIMPAVLMASMGIAGPGTHLTALTVNPGWSASLVSLSGNYCAEIIYFDGAEKAIAMLSPGSVVAIETTSAGASSGEDSTTVYPPDTSSATEASQRALAATSSGLNVSANLQAFWSLQNAADSAAVSAIADAESAAVAVVPQQSVNDAGTELRFPAPDCSVSPARVYAAAPMAHQVLLPLSMNMAKVSDYESNIYDSGCATANGHSTYWGGCYTRTSLGDTDPNHWYSIERSQGEGHGTTWGDMTYGNTQQNYGSNTSPVRHNPGSTLSYGSCHTVSFSLSSGSNPQGSVSDSFQVCPSNVEPHWSNHQFHATWQGDNYGGTVGESNEDLASTATGQSDGFYFNVHKGWCYC
ncbi:MAG: hypothetical protein JO079_04510 [Frankiaceae bacterium]|nr:hypothetical protein [Frankiaceae bacterium]